MIYSGFVLSCYVLPIVFRLQKDVANENIARIYVVATEHSGQLIVLSFNSSNKNATIDVSKYYSVSRDQCNYLTRKRFDKIEKEEHK